MSKKMKRASHKAASALKSLSARALSIAADKRGLSELATVVLLIIVAVVIIAVIFMPAISSWFSDTVMPALTEETENMFNFAP
jgi:hypothetical protein